MSSTTWPRPTAPVRTPVGPPRAHRVQRAAAATVAAGLVAGLIGGGHPPASLAAGLVIVVVALAIAAGIPMTGPARALVVVPAAALAATLVLRTSAWLLVPNLIAALAVVCLGLSVGRGGPLVDSAHGYRRRMATLLRGAALAPQRAVLGIRAIEGQSRRAALRGAFGPIALGVGMAAVVAGVLASGDALFASFLDVGDVMADGAGRFVVALVAMSAVVLAGGATAAAERRPPFPAATRATPEQLVLVAVPLVAVYVAYVGVQVSAVLLGRAYVTERTGLTWAEYARSGFFQLVAVAMVTFLGLTVCRPVLRSASARARRTLIALASVAAVCTLAMVVAAIVKLDLYAEVFGLTMLRLYTTVFAAWLGLAVLIAWWSLFRRRGEWVVPLVASTAIVGVLAMNVVDPERIVAEHNLTDTIDSNEFDIRYLLGLGDAAVPSLVDHFDELPDDAAAAVRSELCPASSDPSFLDWNATRAAARAAIERWC